MGIREQLKAAIFGQESSSGAADTSQENYAGARGPMQVTKKTFEGMKSKGLIPNNYDHANDDHTMEAGNKLIDVLADKFNDDPKKVAAAYYSGEKAVRADGTIADFKDLKNDKAPTTLQYVEQVLARMGSDPKAEAVSSTPVGRYDASGWRDAERPVPVPKAPAAAPKGPALPFAGAPDATAPVDGYGAALAAQEAAAQKARGEVDDSSFLSKVGRATITQGITGAVLERIVKPTFDPVPGFNPREQAKHLYERRSEDDHSVLDRATSLREAEYESFRMDERADAQRHINMDGTGIGILASITGGLGEGAVLGLGAMKAFQVAKVGSSQLAAQGLKGQAVLSSVGENVVGNLAGTAAQQTLDPYIGLSDYAMAAGMGVAASGLTLRGIHLEAEAAGVRAAGERIMEDAAAKIIKVREKAVANVGVDAEPKVIMAEMERLEAQDVRAQVANTTSEIPQIRKFDQREVFENNLDEVTPDAKKVSSVAPTKGKDGLQADGTYNSEDPLYFVKGATEERRIELALSDPKWIKAIAEATGGTSMATAQTKAAGVHFVNDVEMTLGLRPGLNAIRDLAKQFLPNSRIIVGLDETADTANARVISAGNTHFIGLKGRQTPTEATKAAVHELGHAVFHETVKDIPPSLLSRMVGEHQEFIKLLRGGDKRARFRRFSEGDASVFDDKGSIRGQLPYNKYVASFDEYTAEAFVRFVQRQTRTPGSALVLDKGAVALLKSAWEAVKRLYDLALQKGYLSKDEAFSEYFESVLKGKLRQEIALGRPPEAIIDSGIDIGNYRMDVRDPVVANHGLENVPTDTPQKAAEARFIRNLYARAEDWAATNPIDETRLNSLTDNGLFNVASTGLLMLKSKNPVVRMLASELVESASGATQRQSTAAIAKHMLERQYMGNTINDIQTFYQSWRATVGGNAIGDLTNGQNWQHFNRMVAEELEGRRAGATRVESPLQVVQAADVMQNAYERMRVSQVNERTLGWGALPETSVGYMPHKMSPERVRNMTNDQSRVLHQAMADQFVLIEGFDRPFSEQLAENYIDRIRHRSLGGHDAPMNLRQPGAADVVQDALNAMGMTQDEIRAAMARYRRGAAGHTKRRLDLDLTLEHTAEDGSTFRLMDLFETDQLRLARSQAGRVSGEVALARHGIMGQPGLALARRAMEFGSDAEKVGTKELEAFDQVAAEFMSQPFGTATGLWASRAMQATSLARLGGMGFTQFAEYINGIAHVGVAKTFSAIAGMPRLISEARALARGERVDNSIIGSIEHAGGAEFGTDAYKMVFPFDNPEMQYQTYGKDTVTMADRLLRGGTHLQGKLSFWRAIHAAQSRGMAEQIVHKAAKMIRDGGSDRALADMGIDTFLASRLRTDLDSIARFEGNNLVEFNISRARDPVAASDFIQAVHRGAAQIIQGTFIGETGRWAHNDLLKLVTQFRTYSITSVEKQWARQVGNHGLAATFGILMGSIVMAAPVYIARTVAAAQGRKDKEAYLDKQLTLFNIAKASLNYVALSGLSKDFIDGLETVTGTATTGARAGTASKFVGNVIAPSLGLADDLWAGIQNTKTGTNPHDLLKAAPFSRLPWMIPVINGLD